MTRGLCVAAALLASSLAGTRPALAQSIVTGDVMGRIVDPSGAPLQGALVTLSEPGSDEVGVAMSGPDGRFTFSFLSPGRYEVLAEALGRRPVLVASLAVTPGRATMIDLPLEPAAPPVDRRDTLRHAGLPEATGASLAWVDPEALRALPDRARDLSYLASLSSATDEALGFDGLPERFTRVYADGQPFTPARHPGSDADPGRGLLFPTSSIVHASAFRGTSDVEWDGAPGGFLALSTGVNRPGVPEAFGLWSGDALWSGAALEGVEGETPGFNSFWAGAGTTLQLVPDTARLHFAFEGSRTSRPLAPLVTDSVAGLVFPITGEDPDPTSPLARPALEDVTSTSGSARLEWALSERGSLQARLSGAAFSTEHAARPSPEPIYLGATPAVEGADGAASVNLVVDLSETLAVEVRGGASLSRRDFAAEGAALGLDQAATTLLDPAATFGADPALGGEVRRTDFGASAALHLATGPHRLKGGIRAGHASYAYDVFDNGRGSFLFGDAAGVGGAGMFVGVDGTAPETSFGVNEIGGFLQYRWNPVPAIVLTAGTRLDLEMLPSGDVRPDARWTDLTGLDNTAYESEISTLGALLHASWDLTGQSRTVLEGGVGVQHGDVDPAALHEVMLNSGTLDVRRAVGEMASWPAPPGETGTTSTGTSLSLLGPDLRPPQSTRAVLGFAHRFGDATTLRVSGSARRTEYLLRRSDLNVPAVAAGTDVDGRDVLAPLVLEGGVLAPDLSGWRRFGLYDQVWALDADGWSRYQGLTVGLDQALPAGGLLFARYTYSETEDNLVGLRSARRGAAVAPGIDAAGGEPWAEGVSDLDVPHRLSAGAMLRASFATVTGVYRFRSGLPFTPMVRAGIDANGDGSWLNDVAFVPEDAEGLDELALTWDCVAQRLGSFAERNACRGEGSHRFDVRLALGPALLGDVSLELVVDVLNVTDQEEGLRDDALLTLDPGGALERDEEGRWRVPYRVNPGFGSFLMKTDPGRLVRIGVRVGVR